MGQSWTSRLAVAFTAGSLVSLASTQATSKVHIIKAGVGGFKFEPAQIPNVAVGDVVSFEFYPPDHSVARAEFGSACVPYEYTGKGKTGFWSGEQIVNSMADVTHYNVTINSTEPVFFYCAAPNSCKSELMVGVINPNSTQTLAAQIVSAKSAHFQVAPGQPIPKEGGTTVANGPTSTPSPAPSSDPGTGGHKTPMGVIIGIAVGIVAFLGLCAALFFFIGRHKSMKEIVRKHDEGASMKPVGVGGGYTELGFVQSSAFPQPPQTPQGVYPQDFGTPLPAYSSPHLANSHMSMNAGLHYYNDQKVGQPVVAELHSPTLGRGFAAELEAPCTPRQEKKG
ncbi:hypothetical protein GQ44DRAFT_624454 [Phaeosphaeriaceae sp. PMI808]|nr:hypothetical protein GQ44DRAFT_624454 [Phaeosphaeriaceae sp. PMI808]